MLDDRHPHFDQRVVDLIDSKGGVAHVARSIGLSRQAVSLWRTGANAVPLKRKMQIEVLPYRVRPTHWSTAITLPVDIGPADPSVQP